MTLHRILPLLMQILGFIVVVLVIFTIGTIILVFDNLGRFDWLWGV